MKNKQVFIFIFLFTGFFTAPVKAPAQVNVNFQLFYDELSPYGTWVDDSEYGYAWIPDVADGFSPYYTNGYWALTDAGWTWVSSYPWGWAPFHYGSWYTDAIYGPMWIPDNEWGPGWVSWRSSKSYYGWAPLRPDYGHGHDGHDDRWTFVRNRDFGRKDIHNYYVNSSRNNAIMPYSKTINNNRQDKGRNVTYNAGPNRDDVHKRSGRTFAPVTISERNTPGQKIGTREVQMYRPQVQKDGNTGLKPTPGNVRNRQELKTSEQRRADAPAANTRKPMSRPQRTAQPATQQRMQPPQKSVPSRLPASPKQQPRPSQKAGGGTQPQHTSQSAQPTHSKPKRNTNSTPRKPTTPKQSKPDNKQHHQ